MSGSAVEILGYIASVVVAVSLTMTNLWRLRWANLVGAIAFTVYGALLAAWPILLVNAFIVVVNVVFLTRMARASDAFELLEVSDDSPFVERFVRFHTEDLLSFFPNFDYASLRGREDDRWLLILRNTLPVGLCVYSEVASKGDRTKDGEVADVELDYVIPGYRDHKNGRFLYATLARCFARRGCRSMQAHSDVPAHRRYLERMGFRPEPTDSSVFRRAIPDLPPG